VLAHTYNALRRVRQENDEFEVSLLRVKFKVSLDYSMRSYLKKKERKI
jgi:hypothetical protein